MTPIKSSLLKQTSDFRKNQTSNGVYPVSSSMSYVYVLRNPESGRLYTGFTFDLKKRLSQHSTSKYERYELIYYEACHNSTDARAREKYLKTGPGKKFIGTRLKRFMELMG